MALPHVEPVGARGSEPGERFAVDAEEDRGPNHGAVHVLELGLAVIGPQVVDQVERVGQPAMTRRHRGRDLESERTMLCRPRRVGGRACAQTEHEPPAADRLHRGRRRGHDARVAVGDVDHEGAEPDRGGGRRERAEQGEALEHPFAAAQQVAGEVVEHVGRLEPGRLGHEHAVAHTLPRLDGRVELDVDDHGRPPQVGRPPDGSAISTAVERGATTTVPSLRCSVSGEEASSSRHVPGATTWNTSGSHHELAIT